MSNDINTQATKRKFWRIFIPSVVIAWLPIFFILQSLYTGVNFDKDDFVPASIFLLAVFPTILGIAYADKWIEVSSSKYISKSALVSVITAIVVTVTAHILIRVTSGPSYGESMEELILPIGLVIYVPCICLFTLICNLLIHHFGVGKYVRS